MQRPRTSLSVLFTLFVACSPDKDPLDSLTNVGGDPSGDPSGGPSGDPTGDPTGDPSGDPSSGPSSESGATEGGTGSTGPGTSGCEGEGCPTTATTEVTATSTSGDVSGTSSSLTSESSVSSSSSGGSEGFGLCGWSVRNGYYGCDGTPGLEDPEGVAPIACPDELPQEDDPCTNDGPINDIGCCSPNGNNYYCAEGKIVLDPCGP